MNDKIQPYSSNVAFCARYIKFNNAEKMPKKVYEAVLKNDAVEEFLNEGKPKTLFDKLLDLFKRDDVLFVDYEADVFSKFKEAKNEPYMRKDKLTFSFGKENSPMVDRKTCPITGFQRGIKRQPGSIPKPGEHYAYKPPVRTAEDSIAEQVNDIKDLGAMLKFYA